MKNLCIPLKTIGIILLVLFITPLITESRVFAAVVVNELLPKDDDQWVELYNTGDTTVSMNQWTIQNASGEKKTFVLNASAIVNGHGFYVIHKSQSGISMSENGDAIILTDDHGTQQDLQGFPGILGYKTAWGRAPDGTGLMTGCTNPTPNAPNDCPVPTPTPTPVPVPATGTPVPTPTYASPAPPVEETVSQFTNNPSDESIPRIITPPIVLGVATTPTPTLAPGMVKIEIPNSFILSKRVIVQAAIILIAWATLATVAHISKRKRKLKKKSSTPPSQTSI